jgi:hypothetical protein
MNRRLLRALLPVCLTLGSAIPAAAQDAVRSGQRVSLGRGPIEIYNAVGIVTLRAGNEAQLTATARGSDGERLRFFVDREGGGARFRVVYPDVDAIAAPSGMQGSTELNLRSDGTFGGDRGRGGNRVRIRDRGGFQGSADIELTVPAGTQVTVHLAVGRSVTTGVDGRVTIDTYSADAEATGITGEWLFDSGSGDVVVRGMRGSLRIDTGSGNGTVENVSGDLLDVDTGSGNVDATNVSVGRFRFDTGSGDVRARGLTAPRGEADVGSGDVVLDYTGGTVEELLVDTGSGEVSITLPRAADVRVTIDTGSGDVTVQRDGAQFERRGDDGTVFRFGEGRGRIRIDTGGGDVTIR